MVTVKQLGDIKTVVRTKDKFRGITADPQNGKIVLKGVVANQENLKQLVKICKEKGVLKQDLDTSKIIISS